MLLITKNITFINGYFFGSLLLTRNTLMKTYPRIIVAFYFACLLLSCNHANDHKAENLTADTTANNFASSSAAVENNKDATRKFIRTADLKFKVNSVIKSTYDIEETTNRQGGFVTYTNLASTIDNYRSTPVSKDSSLETTYYTITNSITIRVPNVKLDTTLKEISKNIDYLDHRIIKAEDVSLQIFSNNLAQVRSSKIKNRLSNAIDSKGKTLKETTIAEEILLSKQVQNDDAEISNLSLADQIDFSTIDLSIYQRQTIKRELVANEKNIDAYEPGFATKMLESFKYGWRIIETLLVFLATLWAIFLFSILVYFAYKLYRRKIKSQGGQSFNK
ncbi:MAG: DUF4349 domain-containing protein [Ferruginibacter sp.]